MSFESSMKVLLDHEGGFVDDPMDRGGWTKYGITRGTLARARKVHDVTKQDVMNLTVDEAKKIYKAEYWDKVSLDKINSQKLQTIMFDQAVLYGPATVAKMVQEILGLKVDGDIGDKSIAAINGFKNDTLLAVSLLLKIQTRAIRIVKADPTQIRFLEGWINRTHNLIKSILQ